MKDIDKSNACFKDPAILNLQWVETYQRKAIWFLFASVCQTKSYQLRLTIVHIFNAFMYF